MIVPRLRRIATVGCMMMLCVMLVPYIFQSNDTVVAGVYMVALVPILWYLVTCVLNYSRHGVARIIGAAIQKRAWQFVANQVVTPVDHSDRIIFCQAISKKERLLWVIIDAHRLRYLREPGTFRARVFRVRHSGLEIPVAVCNIIISPRTVWERGVLKHYFAVSLPAIPRRLWQSYHMLIKRGLFENHKRDLRRLLLYVQKTRPLGGVRSFVRSM